MDRRQFLKFLAQSSASVGATVFVERVWGFPTVAALSNNKNKLFFWGAGILDVTSTTSPAVNILTPKKFLSRHNFTSIRIDGGAANAVAFGFTQKGAVLTWGDNARSQQGVVKGTIDSPVHFGTTTTWSQLSANASHSVGIQAISPLLTGTLWTWGYNFNGQLGKGTSGETTPINNPLQIGGLTTWESVYAAFNATFALENNGNLWSWGQNANGNFLGHSTSAINFVVPTQVTPGTAWAKISPGRFNVMAIKTDQTLWSWGQNASGQIGNNSIAPSAFPVPVLIPAGQVSTWSNISASWETSFGVKTDGTLWAWGYNPTGELGIGTIGHVSTPVQIGSATNWAYVSASITHVIGLKTDSTIWGWGSNDKGQLGTGSTSGVISTPIQIGSKNTWLAIGTTNSTSFGIRK